MGANGQGGMPMPGGNGAGAPTPNMNFNPEATKDFLANMTDE